MALSGRAKLSGVASELRFTAVYTIRGDRITRGREYLTHEQALESVGLRA